MQQEREEGWEGQVGGVAPEEEGEGDEEQRLLLVQREALRYQSLEELRAVSRGREGGIGGGEGRDRRGRGEG